MDLDPDTLQVVLDCVPKENAPRSEAARMLVCRQVADDHWRHDESGALRAGDRAIVLLNGAAGCRRNEICPVEARGKRQAALSGVVTRSKGKETMTRRKQAMLAKVVVVSGA